VTLEALCALPPARAEALGVVHTLREILQQPRVWLDTFDRVRENRAPLVRLLQRSGLYGARPPEIVLIGAGSSDFVAQLVAPAFRSRFRTATHVLPSTDLLTQTASLLLPRNRYLFVWFTRSGTTPEALELVHELERHCAPGRHLLITCNAQGELARRLPSARSQCLMLPDAVNDRGLAMTSSFTSMALAGLLLALGPLELEAVAMLSRAAERLFDRAADDLANLARRRDSSVCFLGSGSLKAAAGECSLKLLELSSGRVKTRFDSFLGVRHGPLASLDRNSALVGFLSRSPAERLYELELVREVRHKALAGPIALVTPEPEPRAHALADLCVDLELPRELPEPLRPLLDVIIGQQLALFSSLAHGIRPDTPSESGAVARVVTRIRPVAEDRGDDAR
jgi:tagatose-6-phosphate ketose/aldose isomerase